MAIAKNYLTEAELEVLNRDVNLYIEYPELQALERKPVNLEIERADTDLKKLGKLKSPKPPEP